MADEARLHSLLDLIEQARGEGDTATEQKATQAYHREQLAANPTTGGPQSREGPRTLNSSPLQKALGALDAGYSGLSSAIVGPVASGAAGLAATATGQDAPAWREAAREATVYQPQTRQGHEYAKQGGRVLRKTLAPVGRVADAADQGLRDLGSGGASVADLIDQVGSTVSDLAGVAPAAGVGVAAGKEASRLTRTVGRRYFDADAKANRLAKDAAGGNLESIRAANAAAPDTISASQAAHGIDQDPWQALAAEARRNDQSSGFRMLDEIQEANREGLLRGVTPDLEKATKARSAASDPLYKQVDEAVVELSPRMQSVLSRLPKGILEQAKEHARVQGRPFILEQSKPGDVVMGTPGTPPKVSGETLSYIKLALDKAAQAKPLAGGIDAVDPAVVQAFKPAFISAFEEQVPAFKDARAAFAKGSEPINQSRVLDEITKVLRNSAGGERVTPFTNAIDKTPDALVKRSTGTRRYGGLDDILNPSQSSAVDEVVRQLRRDKTLDAQAAAGKGGLRRILESQPGIPRMPPFISAKTAALNKGMDILQNSVDKAVLDKIVAGMRSGKSANELLRDLPPVQRRALIPALEALQSKEAVGASIVSGDDR